MSNFHNIEDMEAQVKEIKAEQTRCSHHTLSKLAELYDVLNSDGENSVEEAAVAVSVSVPEPVA